MFYFSIQNASPRCSEAAGARWRFYPRIMFRLSSECRRIVFLLAEAIHGVSAEILNSEFRGRRSIWWGWRVTLLAPRIVNDVSYVTRINHEIHFAWQAQYLVRLGVTLVAPRIVNDVSCETRINHESYFVWQVQYSVKLEADCACSAHCKWRFISDADQSWDSFLRGRRSIWWSWIVIPVAPRIVNDVSCETQINHHSHFVWQVQYSVKLEADCACSAHCKWRFICDADQSWDSFCVAGAVFGEVGLWLLLLRAL